MQFFPLQKLNIIKQENLNIVDLKVKVFEIVVIDRYELIAFSSSQQL